MLGDNRHPNSDETYPSNSNRVGDRSGPRLWQLDASAGSGLFVLVPFAADFRSTKSESLGSAERFCEDTAADFFANAERNRFSFRRQSPRTDTRYETREWYLQPFRRASFLGRDQRSAVRGSRRVAHARLFFDAQHEAARAAGDFAHQ